MDLTALKTIKQKNPKWSIAQCKKHAQKVINIITNKYPEGCEAQYFVLPGFEHVTKNQPIISFNLSEGSWGLDNQTKFKI